MPSEGKQPESRDDERKKIIEAKKAEEQLKAMLRVVLEPEAYERLSNVQHVNQQLFLTAAQNVLGFYKTVGRKLEEREVLALLKRIKTVNETKTSIRFERK